MCSLLTCSAQKTERIYLSGHGCDDMVQWDFMCSDGQNAGKWTKIGVPSCWELQGFGTFQYGMKFYGKPHPEGIAAETGKYKYEFSLPQAWQGRQILLCFEASMTDTYCEINGRKAGSKHKGGFSPFYYDVSDRVFFGKKKNRIEVTVNKESEEESVNMAERRADYWNFGGIIRPVYIMAKPAQNIERVAIDARHDGRFRAEAYLCRAIEGSSVSVDIVDLATKKVVASATESTRNSDCARFDFQVSGIKPWSAETPNRYEAVFTLYTNAATAAGNATAAAGNTSAGATAGEGRVSHIERAKFGFRTIEVRPHDGVYVNGQKMLFRGVNRHSFRPETGRTLSYKKNLEDVQLIRSMNMNAVRLSHYPADPEFYDICDSLGLYVLDEQPGWHWYHNTINGSQLVEAMVKRDQNHPSVIFWDNGNEGGFNMELDAVFTKYDLQKRTVLYPWANEHGMETKHYRSWGETQALLREPEIVMPTEFLHGLYDGGHGAGLYDYWEMMRKAPRCAGGFLWDLQDEGVKRVDQDGHIDNVGNYGADGIVGPHLEREGSYYTIKEVWCPVHIDVEGVATGSSSASSQNATASGQADNAMPQLLLSNRYDFINLSSCKLRFTYLKLPTVGNSKVKKVGETTVAMPDIAPHSEGRMAVAGYVKDADVMEITVIDDRGEEIFTKSQRLTNQNATLANGNSVQPTIVSEDVRTLVVSACNKTYTFNRQTGMLQNVSIGGSGKSGSKRQADGATAPAKAKQKDAKGSTSGSFDFVGPRFIAAKRADRSQDGFYNHDDKEAEKKKTQFTTYADQGKLTNISLSGDQLVATYEHGSLQKTVWTFLADGSVRLDYQYAFGGVIDEMGVMFDYPEKNVQSKQWVGKGPYRVWQNRQQGPQYGYWQNDYNDPIPGETFEYPEFKGFFSCVSWMNLTTTDGNISLQPVGEEKDCNVGVFTPRDGRDHILYTLPETGISLLKVIPAVRNKVNCTDLNGPSAQPFWANGDYSGSVILRFE